jgi:hypothetical protein
MELHFETFLTVLYVMTDDLYVSVVLPQLPASGGPEPKLSDSEVLCLGLAAQWRSGVAWKTERGFVRYALKHLRPYFPGMTSQSAFNRRLRRLWGAFILLQQAIADQLWSAQECELWTMPRSRWRAARVASIPVSWPTVPASARAAMIAISTVCTYCWWSAPMGRSLVGPWPPATFRTAGWPNCS